MDRPSRSTHVTGSMIGVGFVVVGVQRLLADSVPMGVALVLFGAGFMAWHLRRLARLRAAGRPR